MTKEEHEKVLAALQLASGHVSLSYKQCEEVAEAGYCMTCYNFVCECEGQYD